MKIKGLPILLFVLCCTGAMAQNTQQVLKNIWQEKTEWREKARENAAGQRTRSGTGSNDEKSLADTNIVVSATADVQSEVHAAINPTDSNNIVVSSNFVSTGSNLPSATNYLYYTHDFGQTWSTSSFLTGPAGTHSFILGGGDPNFVYNDSGRAFFSYINLWSDASFNTWFDLCWISSTDGGNTWSRNATNPLIGRAPSSLFGSGGAFDKEWMAIDKNTSSANYGNLYCSFFEVNANTGAQSIGVRRRTPAAGVFDTVSTKVNTGSYKVLQFSSIAVDRTGNVHVTFFATADSITYSIYHAVSHDGAQTFAPEVKISDVSIARFTVGQENDSIQGISGSRLYPSPYVAADNTAGAYSNRLYMVWTANGTSTKLNNGNDVYISISNDGGTTWSAARVLNDNTTNLKSDQYYPAITVSPQGRVAVIWWDRRDDSLNVKSNIYMTYSDDGGQTFIPNFKVSSKYTDFSTVGNLNGGFGIGEYNAVIATNDYIIPVWADGRDNTGQLNLYSAFIHAAPGQSVGIRNVSTVNGPLKVYSVYPNPAKDVLNLQYESVEAGKMEISVFDMAGREVLPVKNLQVAAEKATSQLNIAGLAAGSYLVKLTLNGTVNVRQFVKAQ